MLGQVKNIDFRVCKLLTQVVHVTLDTLLAKARSFVDNCTFCDRIRQRDCPWRIKLPTDPLDSVFVCTANCAVATVEHKTFEFTAVLQTAKHRRVHARELTGLRHVHEAQLRRLQSDLTGSVDHTNCCTLHATAQSFVWTRSV